MRGLESVVGARGKEQIGNSLEGGREAACVACYLCSVLGASQTAKQLGFLFGCFRCRYSLGKPLDLALGGGEILGLRAVYFAHRVRAICRFLDSSIFGG